MASRADLARLAARQQQQSTGFSSARFANHSAADIDLIAAQFVSGPPRKKFRVGGFYSADLPDAATANTLLLVEDVLVVGALLVQEYVEIEEIGVDVTTAGSEGNLYTAIYADRGDGYPGALIHASAALTATPGAFKSTASLSVDLIPGLYWIGCVHNQITTTAATVRSASGMSPYVGATTGADDTAMSGYQSPADVTGAPPANFSSTVATAIEIPRVMFKVKLV